MDWELWTKLGFSIGLYARRFSKMAKWFNPMAMFFHVQFNVYDAAGLMVILPLIGVVVGVVLCASERRCDMRQTLHTNSTY